jgi:hypothetical protein
MSRHFPRVLGAASGDILRGSGGRPCEGPGGSASRGPGPRPERRVSGSGRSLLLLNASLGSKSCLGRVDTKPGGLACHCCRSRRRILRPGEGATVQGTRVPRSHALQWLARKAAEQRAHEADQQAQRDRRERNRHRITWSLTGITIVVTLLGWLFRWLFPHTFGGA